MVLINTSYCFHAELTWKVSENMKNLISVQCDKIMPSGSLLFTFLLFAKIHSSSLLMCSNSWLIICQLNWDVLHPETQSVNVRFGISVKVFSDENHI